MRLAHPAGGISAQSEHEGDPLLLEGDHSARQGRVQAGLDPVIGIFRQDDIQPDCARFCLGQRAEELSELPVERGDRYAERFQAGIVQPYDDHVLNGKWLARL